MNNRKTKTVLIICLIVLLSVAFTACGKVSFTYRQNSDGTYTQTVDVTLDAHKLPEGYTVNTAANRISDFFKSEGFDVKMPADGRIIAVKNYANLTEVNDSLLQSGLFVMEEDIKKSGNAFMDYREVTGIPYIGMEFLDSYKNSIKLNFAPILGVSTAEADAFVGAMDSADVSYTYITPNRSVKSNADEIVRDDDGNYVHVWNLDGEDDDVYIKQSAVRGAAWYGIAIVVAACVTLIVALVKTFKKSKPLS